MIVFVAQEFATKFGYFDGPSIYNFQPPNATLTGANGMKITIKPVKVHRPDTKSRALFGTIA